MEGYSMKFPTGFITPRTALDISVDDSLFGGILSGLPANPSSQIAFDAIDDLVLSDFPAGTLKLSDLEDDILAENVIVVNSTADLPVPTDIADGLGTCYHLEAKYYSIGAANITLDYPIVGTAEVNKSTYVVGNASNLTFSMVSGGGFVSNPTTSIATLLVRNLNVYITSGGSLFDIDGAGNLLVDEITFLGTGALGTVKNCGGFGFRDTTLLNFSGKLCLDSSTILYMRGVALNPGQQISEELIEVTGTFLSNVFSDMQAIPYAGDAVFYIDPAINGRVEMNTVNAITVAGGIAFGSGSLTQQDPRVRVHASPGIPDSQTIGSMHMERNTTTTTISAIGTTGTITAFSDAGGGNTTVVTGSTPTDGTIVWIINAGYSGKFTTSNTVLNTSFDIVKDFTGTDIGTWENNWVKVAGTTIAGENERAGMTDDNELTFGNLEEEHVRVSVSTNPKNDLIAATKEWEFAVLKNNARLHGSLKTRDMTNRAGEGMLLATATALSGDVFEVYTRNVQDTTDQIMVNMTVVIEK